jgi:hypothetical protein
VRCGVIHRPADDAPVEQVTNRGDVQRPLAGGELGQVSDPSPVRPLGGEGAVEPTGCRRDVRTTTPSLLLGVRTDELVVAHEPGDALATDPDPATVQLPVHPRGAVGPPAVLVNLTNLDEQFGVGEARADSGRRFQA